METGYGTKSWYLLYTKPKCEDPAAGRLIDGGFEVLNPKIREKRFVRGRLQETVSPLFPCYIFARFDIYKSYRLIKYTRGVKRIVGAENSPAAVSEDIVSSIRDRMEDGVVKASQPEFRPGDEVRVNSGALEGFDAVFVNGVKDADRVSILIKTVNARITIDRSQLSRAHND